MIDESLFILADMRFTVLVTPVGVDACRVFARVFPFDDMCAGGVSNAYS